MLTRLKVSGFKNLVDVDVRFGPFTCVAGANGVGKSNLFDAIRFLSAIADRPLIDAALSVRDGKGRTADVHLQFDSFGDYREGEKRRINLVVANVGAAGEPNSFYGQRHYHE
nr:AAA family ATPase [Cylindrospermum sp. FACHB-282]